MASALAHFFYMAKAHSQDWLCHLKGTAIACAFGRLLVVQMGVVLPGCPAESLLA